ncbi:MAG: response regulator transcription factor [bacterium]|nr:response regulator transcription factor [bacterium]
MDTILVVDDNKEITDLIESILVKEGYNVIKAYSGIEALGKFSEQTVLCILDVMMPGIDGCEVCRRIRKKSNVPILYLSAKGTDVDKVIGLSAGGDDYMVKPFSSIELVARVKALLRRYLYHRIDKPNAANCVTIDSLTIDLDAHTVMKYQEKVSLTKTEYDILVLLATNPNRVFSTEEIFKNVWKEKYYEGNNTVMVHIARLREKIEDSPRNAKIVKNVWGVGYKVEA